MSRIISMSILIFLFSAITLQAQYSQAKDTSNKREIWKLTVPMRNGFVYKKPLSNNILCISDGISIYSHQKKDSVISLLSGEVETKVEFDGVTAIIIRTGDYLLLYSGVVEDCLLNKGDTVAKNQFLFNVIREREDLPSLTVLIADKTKCFYPEECIRFIESHTR